MKKQVLAIGMRKAMMVAGFVSVLTVGAMAAPAENRKNTKLAQSEIEYVGTTKDGIVFNVKFENADAARFDLVIKNEYGDVVYQQQFSDKNFDKKILLVKEPGDAHLTFLIKAGDASYKESFDITTVIRTVEDVVVTSAK